MFSDETVARIQVAIQGMDRELHKRLELLAKDAKVDTGDLAKILDELERAIDDVQDERTRLSLLRVLARLDEREQVDPSRLVYHDLFDPLRILMTDIRHQL